MSSDNITQPTITFEEYEKLQLEFIESQRELKEITVLFDSYRKETEQMEDLQTRQIEIQEQQLEKSTLEKEYLMVTLKKELQEISLETQKILLEKEDEVQKLREELKQKTQAMTKILSSYSESKKQDEELRVNGDEQSKEKIIEELRKDLTIKEIMIHDLTSDIKQNKSVMEEQKMIFKKFSQEILEKTQERDQQLSKLKDQEISILQAQLLEKDEQIEKLEAQSFEQAASEEENSLMREMITQQQEKLISLAKNFENYRDESEKLFLGQIALRDQTIKDQQKQIEAQANNQLEKEPVADASSIENGSKNEQSS